VDIKGHQVSHTVIARPRQFMGHRFPRDHQRAFRLFLLVKPLDNGVEADGNPGRFHVSPCQIRVAVFIMGR
jgi:hypothetical protein